MVDNYVESKLSNVESSVKLKPYAVEVVVDVKLNDVKPFVELKLSIEAFVDVKPFLVGSVDVKTYVVGSTVSKHRDNEVDMAPYFFTKDTRKVRDDIINWVC